MNYTTNFNKFVYIYVFIIDKLVLFLMKNEYKF